MLEIIERRIAFREAELEEFTKKADITNISLTRLILQELYNIKYVLNGEIK